MADRPRGRGDGVTGDRARGDGPGSDGGPVTAPGGPLGCRGRPGGEGRRGRGRERPGSSAAPRRPARTAALLRAWILLAGVRPQRHGALGHRRDGQRRVDPDVGRDRRAVDDVQALVAVHPVVRVDDAVVGGQADHSPADEVRGHGGVDDLAPVAHGSALDDPGQATHRVVGDRDPARVRLALALPAAQPEPAGAGPLAEHDDRVVHVLHDQGDDVALGRASDPHRTQGVHGVGHHGLEPLLVARDALGAVAHHGAEQEHRVGALAVADRLDVRVRVGEERRGDGHAMGEVALARRCGVHDADQGLGVGPGQCAQPRRQGGELAIGPQPVQQALGPPGAGREDHVLGGERAHRAFRDLPRIRRRHRPARSPPCPRTLPTAFVAREAVARVSTAHRPSGSGRTSVTVVSGWTTAPAPSARPR